MVRSLMSVTGAVAACAPSPQERAVQGPGPEPRITVPGLSEAPTDPNRTRRRAEDQARAAAGPTSVSAAENPAHLPGDTPEAALGRRALSTTFVMVGPDRHLTVERRDGRVLLLRDVVMGPKTYCGVQLLGDVTGVRYCGGYGEVAAARPGGAPAVDGPKAANLDALEAPGSATRRE